MERKIVLMINDNLEEGYIDLSELDKDTTYGHFTFATCLLIDFILSEETGLSKDEIKSILYEAIEDFSSEDKCVEDILN